MQLFLFLIFTWWLKEEPVWGGGLSSCCHGSAVSGSAERGSGLGGGRARPRGPQSLLVLARDSRVACWQESALLLDFRQPSPVGEGTAPALCSSPAHRSRLRTLCSLGVCVCVCVCVCVLDQKEGDCRDFRVFLSFPEAIQAGGPNSCVPGGGRLRAGLFSVDAPPVTGEPWPGHSG